MTIGAGHGAEILNNMFNTHVGLKVPEVKVVSSEEFGSDLTGEFSEDILYAVKLHFEGKFCGTAKLIFSVSEVDRLIEVFVPFPPENIEPESIRRDSMTEIGNIVLNSVLGSVSNQINLHFKYKVPRVTTGSIEEILSERPVHEDSVILLAKTRFILENLSVNGNIIIYFETSSLENLISIINAPM